MTFHTQHTKGCHYAIIDSKVKHVSKTEIELTQKLRRSGIKLSEFTATNVPVNAQYDCMLQWTKD